MNIFNKESKYQIYFVLGEGGGSGWGGCWGAGVSEFFLL